MACLYGYGQFHYNINFSRNMTNALIWPLVISSVGKFWQEFKMCHLENLDQCCSLAFSGTILRSRHGMPYIFWKLYNLDFSNFFIHKIWKQGQFPRNKGPLFNCQLLKIGPMNFFLGLRDRKRRVTRRAQSDLRPLFYLCFFLRSIKLINRLRIH